MRTRLDRASRSGWPTAPTIPGRPTSGASSNELADVSAGAARRHFPTTGRCYTEHKPYEPAFYSSVNADWGSSLLLAQHAGDRAQVPRRPRPPSAQREHRAGREPAGDGRSPRRLPLQRLEVRRRRPHRRLDPPVPVLPRWCWSCVDAGDGAMPPVRYMIDASHNLKDPLEDLDPGHRSDTGHARAGAARRPRRTRRRAGRQRSGAGGRSAARPRTAPTCVRSSRRRAAATAPRLAPLVTYRRIGYRAAALASRGEDAVATGL